jgi:hypothetical protein
MRAETPKENQNKGHGGFSDLPKRRMSLDQYIDHYYMTCFPVVFLFTGRSFRYDYFHHIQQHIVTFYKMSRACFFSVLLSGGKKSQADILQSVYLGSAMQADRGSGPSLWERCQSVSHLACSGILCASQMAPYSLFSALLLTSVRYI